MIIWYPITIISIMFTSIIYIFPALPNPIHLFPILMPENPPPQKKSTSHLGNQPPLSHPPRRTHRPSSHSRGPLLHLHILLPHHDPPFPLVGIMIVFLLLLHRSKRTAIAHLHILSIPAPSRAERSSQTRRIPDCMLKHALLGGRGDGFHAGSGGLDRHCGG